MSQGATPGERSMSKRNKIISVLSLALSLAANLSADTFANKTYYAESPDMDRVLLDKMGHIKQPCLVKEGSFGGRVHGSLFYSQVRNNDKLASYFGNHASGIEVVPDHGYVAGSESVDLTKKINGFNIDLGAQSHMNQVDGSSTDEVPMSGILKITPKSHTWGVRLSYEQELSSLLDGLGFSVTVPVASVAHVMAPELLKGVDSALDDTDGGKGLNMLDYFAGTVGKSLVAPNTNSIQAKLSHAKIGTIRKEAAGVADVRIGANWRFWHTDKASGTVCLHTVLPTGNLSTGEFLYEPIYGNNGHWVIGGSLSGAYLFKNVKNMAVRLSGGFDYNYVLEAKEVRTVGIKDVKTAKTLPGSIYRLMVQDRIAGTKPAANFLTQNLMVTPGSQYGLNLKASTYWKDFSFDVGYNLNIRTAEKAKLQNLWIDDRYALSSPQNSSDEDYTKQHGNRIGGAAQTLGGVKNNSGSFVALAGSEVVNSDARQGFSMGGPIQAASTKTALKQWSVDSDDETLNNATTTAQTVRHNLDIDAALTPKQVVHSLSGSVAYACDAGVPCLLSAGGQYDFVDSTNNSLRASWSVWGKVGFSF